MGRGKHEKTGTPKIHSSMWLPEHVWNVLQSLGDGKGLAAGCVKMCAWWTSSGAEEVARLKELVNQPPVCKVCGEPMQAETAPAKINANGTAFIQTTTWTCRRCYDAYEVACCYPEP